MTKSFRLDDELERKLARVSEIEGRPVSAVIREAVERHCTEILGRNLRIEMADVIGSIESDGGRARRTGDALREMLRAKKRHDSD